jgi:cytochrome c oxidase subunit 2
MNETQILITVLYGISVVVAIIVSVFVIRSTAERRRRRAGADLDEIVERENRYAIGVAVSLLALLAVTLFFVPYGDADADEGQTVNVDAFQFGWTLSPDRVTTGEQVTFVIRSKDVQHGFGLYDGTELLKQVNVQGIRPDDAGDELSRPQAMTFTFDEPGTYDILCLEFCGVGHHLMTGELEVVEGS